MNVLFLGAIPATALTVSPAAAALFTAAALLVALTVTAVAARRTVRTAPLCLARRPLLVLERSSLQHRDALVARRVNTRRGTQASPRAPPEERSLPRERCTAGVNFVVPTSPRCPAARLIPSSPPFDPDRPSPIRT